MVAKRKSEKFKRIKCSTLAKLLQENLVEESIYNIANQDYQSVTYFKSTISAGRSTITSTIECSYAQRR